METLLVANDYKLEVKYYGQELDGPPSTEGEVEPVIFDTITYHAALYVRPLEPVAFSRRMFIYKEEGGQQTLLYDLHSDLEALKMQGRSYGLAYLGLRSYEVEGDELTLPEFGVGALRDLNDDGIVEWLVTDARLELGILILSHAGSPGSVRIYAWDGEVYHNASAQFPEFYQAGIDEAQANLQHIPNDADERSEETPRDLQTLLSLLMTPENSEQLEEGKAIVESYGIGYFDHFEGLKEVWRAFAEVFGVEQS